MTSYLDLLPSRERQKIREHLRLSEAEYERLRERVKGPEDLQMELERGKMLAEANLRLKTEPKLRQRLKQKIENDLRERGLDTVTEGVEVTDEMRSAIESGQFDVAVEENPASNQDQLAILLEGRVGEVVPIRRDLGDRYLSGLDAA